MLLLRDLDLWRRLHGGGEVTAAELYALCTLGPARRAPFIGAVARLLDGGDASSGVGPADASVRAAALRVLSGARGVPGLRAIVARLADDDAEVRAEALAALHATAREAPVRYAHALFHADASVRLAALADVPHPAMGIAAYLRADAACATAAAQLPWPDEPLPLAFDLHAARACSHAQFVELLVRTPIADLRAFLERELRRSPEDIEAYLDAAARGELRRAPGHDVLDGAVAAIAACADAPADGTADPRLVARGLDVLVELAWQKAFTRRVAAAIVSHLAEAWSPALWGTCVALEPRVLEISALVVRMDPRALADGAIAGLLRFQWPVKPTVAQVDRLIRSPIAERDLALAAALAGLYQNRRLKRLGKLVGMAPLVERLVASDRGWDAICALPPEQPPIELGWLGKVAAVDARRGAALAGRALAVFAHKRLEGFVDHLQRRQRADAFLAFLGLVEPSDPKAGAVARIMASRLDRAALVATFAALLADGRAHGPELALVVGRAVTDKQLAAVARELDDATLLRFLPAIDGREPLPRDRELALAAVLLGRAPPLHAWATKVTRLEVVEAPPPPPRTRHALDAAQRERIATCLDAELETALAPALVAPTAGLCSALAPRREVASLAACVALLGSTDPLEDVARELDRFAGGARFDDELDLAATAWRTVADLPPLAHARLYRWEAHSDELVAWIDRSFLSSGADRVRELRDTARLAGDERGDRTLAVLQGLERACVGNVALATLWRGIAETIVLTRYRDRTRFTREATPALAQYAAERIHLPHGRFAARIVVALVESGLVPYSAVRAAILERAADTDADTREQLARIARLEGMPPPLPSGEPPPTARLLDEIRACSDLDRLEQLCGDHRRTVVQEATLALVLAGDAGQLRLAALLPRLAILAAPLPVVASIVLWECEAALAAARALTASTALPPAWQYHLCLGLGDLPRAIEAVRAPDSSSWFRREDWETLSRIHAGAHDDRDGLGAAVALACALADAPHYHAYRPALSLLLETLGPPEIAAALRRFLETGTDRPLQLRRDVALHLAARYGDDTGLPILIDELAECDAPSTLLRAIPRAARGAALAALVDAALLAGDPACSEKRMWNAVGAVHVHELARGDLGPLAARILDEASTASARRYAAAFLRGSDDNPRLHDVAQVFAWGVRRGVELTGRLFRVHMTSAERDLGHTYLDGARIFVTPLPMLRSEPHGRDIVEGLVLHELGHHVYHRGDIGQALWKQAHDEGFGPLLNLVADEHLERNLRAVDRGYGDRLKRLGAYAFQHAPQEIAMADLIAAMRAGTAAALIGARLEVAYDEAALRLRRGDVLAALERTGHPLARFARAFRLGLGNRTGDPLVARALELCKARDLAALDMRGLYELALALANLFGGAAALARVFGGPEGLAFGEREDDVFGANLDDDTLQREIERILEPRRGSARSKPLGPRDRLALNVNPDEEFDRITNVHRVRGSRPEHARLATEVDRHATRLRALLDDLGLRWEPVRARLKGHALDRTRLRALTTRGDPRILQARTPVRRTELFLGTLVDCSGSMQAAQNIERARKFAVLIAEAVRPLPGVEARFWGFTDSVIYDAGDAHACDVTGLHADGGNNDAAALLHAANVAAGSRRRAKVLVMISDGLPTECSVAALRGLVTTLTRRRGIVCAQVAVRPLEEECFPHHVVLDDEDPGIAVARFGRMIGDLARRVLGTG